MDRMRNGGEAENAVQGTVQRGIRFEEFFKRGSQYYSKTFLYKNYHFLRLKPYENFPNQKNRQGN